MKIDKTAKVANDASQVKSNFFNELFKASKKAIIYVGIFSLFVNLLMLAVPIYMLQIFDRVLPSFSFETLLYLTLITIGALVVLGALDMMRSQILVRVAHWFDQKTSPETIQKVPDEVIRGNAEALARLRDIPKIRNFLTSPALLVLFDFPWTPIFLIIIFLLHPLLGAFSLIGAIILFVMGIINHLSTRKFQVAAMQASEESQRHITQALRNAETIQAMGMMPNLMGRWFSDNEKTLSKQSDVSNKAGSFRAVTKSFRLILQLGILGLGAFLVLQQSITVGVMIAASILMSRALAPVEQGVSSWRMMIEARESYFNLKKYMLETNPREQRMALPRPEGQLTFEGVFLASPMKKAYILSQINFALEPGELLVIYGPSAAGKTTLARLIMGILKPTMGSARLDGADIYEWDRKDFGTHVGYLPQTVELFQGTVKENIARMGEVDPEKVVAAAKFAGAHEMILQLKDGYDTKVSTVTKTLSGGQLQRIALARVFYGDPKLLVLDEPNSNLDESGFAALIRSLQRAKSEKITTVVITHTAGLLKLADKILILKEGKMAVFGVRDEVIAKLQATVKAAKDAAGQKHS